MGGSRHPVLKDWQGAPGGSTSVIASAASPVLDHLARRREVRIPMQRVIARVDTPEQRQQEKHETRQPRYYLHCVLPSHLQSLRVIGVPGL